MRPVPPNFRVKMAQGNEPKVQERVATPGELATHKRAKGVASSAIDLLTLDYQKGMDLYISQACYACHRIAGFARRRSRP